MKSFVSKKFQKAYREEVMANFDDDRITWLTGDGVKLKPGSIYEWNAADMTIPKSALEKRLEKLENVLKTLGINLEDE